MITFLQMSMSEPTQVLNPLIDFYLPIQQGILLSKTTKIYFKL